jgi:hypothetical protein
MMQWGREEELFEGLREAFETGRRRRNHVVSGEDLSYLKADEFGRLVALFREYFDDIRAIAVLRPPLSYMHSAAQQILQEPRPDIRSLFSRVDVTPWYRERFEKMIGELGQGNCIFIPYSRDAVQDLAARIGLPLKVDDRSDNRSMSIWVARELNQLKPLRSHEEREAAMSRLQALDPSDGRRFEAPMELVEHWQEQIEADSKWLRTVWDAPAGFFDEPMPTVRLADYGIV